MNVLFLSPTFPDEMPLFVEGLARVGARVFGMGDTPEAALPERTRKSLTAYKQVSGLFDEQATVETVLERSDATVVVVAQPRSRDEGSDH